MKTIVRHSFWALSLAAMVASIAIVGLVGCTPKGDGGAGAPPPGPITPSAQCTVGQVYNATYGCLNQNSCTYGYGWVPQTGQCVAGTVNIGTSTNLNFWGSLSITSKENFELMLQNSYLCDPYIIGINIGASNCRNYSQAGYLIFQTTNPGNGTLPTTATIQIGAGSNSPTQRNSNWITGGKVLTMSGTVNLSLYNNSQGFWGQPTGATGGAGGLQVIVDNGLPQSAAQFNVRLEYNGVTVAQGLIKRY